MRLAAGFLLSGFAALALPARAWAAHGVAQFGSPKYPPAFESFDYVNAEAPRGGTLVLSVVSQNSRFDKLNPFSLKGAVAPGVVELMFETLTTLSLDEPNTQYGLLADDIRVAPDFSWTEFHLHALARFSNGERVTAEDVKYSFEVLTSELASPRFRSYFAEVARLVVVDSETVRFEFRRKGRDLSFVAGSLPIFSPRWGRSQEREPVPFDRLRLEPPVATGPYLIEASARHADVIYRKNPDYWGAQIPARRGTYNFERVVYKLYKDSDTQVAALRAGEFDFFSERRMRYWCCQYIGKRFDSGELVKEVLPHANPPAMNGWVTNLRRERLRDPRVRQALNYAFDFDWVNAKILDGEYSPVTSYFTGTSLAARGVPGPDELRLLAPRRAELDPAVFGPVFVRPTTRPPSSIRQNLARALALFEEAGWRHEGGVLKNADGEVFKLQVPGSRSQTMMGGFYTNLTKLGIELELKATDAVGTRKSLSEFDFDLTPVALREARMPGAELWRTFNSKDADVPGSENLAGLKSRVVDELIEEVLGANTQAELETAARALDRVLLHGHYVLPFRYLDHHYVMYHQRLRRPAKLPSYYGDYDWMLATWWDGSADPTQPMAISPAVPASGSTSTSRRGWLLWPGALVAIFGILLGARGYGGARRRLPSPRLKT